MYWVSDSRPNTMHFGKWPVVRLGSLFHTTRQFIAYTKHLLKQVCWNIKYWTIYIQGQNTSMKILTKTKHDDIGYSAIESNDITQRCNTIWATCMQKVVRKYHHFCKRHGENTTENDEICQKVVNWENIFSFQNR
jgi:hypothetical protein